MFTWQQTLDDRQGPLLLPVAHDPLTARQIEMAGFPAYQIGGLSLIGANLALPDIDLASFGDEFPLVRRILDIATRPVLVDTDNGHGDHKMVARVMRAYEKAGASALFIEDQSSPKKCGHMADKHIIPLPPAVARIHAALDALHSSSTFLLARTDAAGPEGIDSAIERAHAYLDAGAHGVYFEGLSSESDLARAGADFRGVPLATSILEGHGKTPWLTPARLGALNYSMILYPTTLLFRSTRAIRAALSSLQNGDQSPPDSILTVEEYNPLVRLPEWQQFESEHP